MPETSVLLLAGAAALTVVLLIVPRPGRRSGNSKAAALKKLRDSGDYRGVTIQHGKCAAVGHCLGRQYRFEEAPALPVSGCKALHCPCSYHGLRERRKRERRLARDRREVIRFNTAHQERRSRGERRRGHVRWHDPDDRD